MPWNTLSKSHRAGLAHAGWVISILFSPAMLAPRRIKKYRAICAVGIQQQLRRSRNGRPVFVGAAKREPWEKLFFAGDFGESLSREEAGPYAESFEWLRLAPSSGNTQPWRVVKEGPGHVYHFFKTIVNDRYEERRLHDIDIGIAMCHFELGAEKHNLRGQWTKTEPHITHLHSKLIMP